MNTEEDLQQAALRMLEIDQLRWNAVDVATPQMLWARGTTPATELAPASAITSRKKYEIAFLEIERDGFLG